jgi:hypothetical protein
MYLDTIQYQKKGENDTALVGGIPLIRHLSVPVGLVVAPYSCSTYSNDRHSLVSNELFDELFGSIMIQPKSKSRKVERLSNKYTRRSRTR